MVLPHCMQTSSRFWAKVGFELGAKVDRKEHKQATLPSVANLTGDVNGWRLRCVDLSSLPAEGATGGTDSLTPSTE